MSLQTISITLSSYIFEPYFNMNSKEILRVKYINFLRSICIHHKIIFQSTKPDPRDYHLTSKNLDYLQSKRGKINLRESSTSILQKSHDNLTYKRSLNDIKCKKCMNILKKNFQIKSKLKQDKLNIRIDDYLNRSYDYLNEFDQFVGLNSKKVFCVKVELHANN
jgi:hypothetical protein